MRWISRIKLIKIAKVAGIIALILSVTMGVFTFFGANGGNFVVNLKPEDGISIKLYDNAEMTKPMTRLSYPSIIDQIDYTYSWLPETIEDGLGDKNDYRRKGYTALSFLLRNESEVPVDLRSTIEMSRVVKGVDSAVRVMVIADGVRKVYAKAKEAPEEDKGKAEDYPEGVISFMSPVIVCEDTYMSIPMNGVIKFTIVIWVEGEDEQCIDEIKGGSMRLFMSINVF